MERTNGGVSSKCAVLIPVSKSSDVFEKVLAPLQNTYLFGESKEAFRYTSAFLFNNSTLQKKYEAFRANRRESGYSEKELKEEYGFLLFDDINKAIELGETGVLTGNSLCKTLGDPSKGVYIAKYSDCLAPDHWYCGKSGFIVILRLTKGRINKVKENYTQNCIAPSVGFDCHESEYLPMVSANTSSFLAYERTQYYLYEQLPGECSQKNLSPSHVCPFAIVPFSYAGVDTKGTMSFLGQSGKEGKVLDNITWRGQLHISSQIFHVRLKSRLGALIPVKLPPVVKVDGVVPMVTLRQFAPKAVFEKHFSGEVSLEGICCSVQEFVPLEVGDPSLSPLIRELKEKDVGLTVHLNESGFLILLHLSNFAMSTDNESSVTEALQAMFLFPGSRAIQKDTKGELEESQISSDILQILPALDYAETEMQKSSIGPSEDTSGQFVQQIKNYAAHIQTGVAATPSKDISPLSKDYDEALTPFSSNPKWTNRLWQWLRSYLSHPVSFQLPVYSVSELLADGNKQKEVLNEDVRLSPREQTIGTDCSIGQEELSSKSTAHVVSSNLQMDVEKKDSETNSILNCTSSCNPTEELVVSIISAEGTSNVIDKGQSGSDNIGATKQLSQSPIAKTNTAEKNPLENSTDRKKLPRGRPKGKRKRSKKSSTRADEPLTFTSQKPDEERLQIAQCPLADDSSENEWTILSMSQCKGGKLTYKYKKVPRSPQLQEDEIKKTRRRRMGNVPSPGLGASSLPRNTDRLDLRPILTGCGRTLVPHGSLNGCLQKKESTDCGQRLNETMSRTSADARDLDPVDGRSSVTTTTNVNAGEKCHNTEAGSPHLETSSCLLECGDHSLVNIAEPDSSNNLPSSTTDDAPHLKGQNRSEHMLCKLKKLFSGRKRKDPQLGLGDSLLPVDAQLSTEPSLKKCKADMDREMLNTESNTDFQQSREKSMFLAQALGLMPIKVPVTLEEIKITDTLQKPLPVSLDCKIIPPEVQSAQLMKTVPSPIQEKLQVNQMLQKRQQQWVTCFYTPIYSITECPQNKVCAKTISFATGQSNALSLLADLALGNVNNQAQPQPDPCAMTKLDPRLDLDNQPIDATKPINQSVLPSMLKQPADIPILPNSQSPEDLLGSNDVINAIAKEHDYSSTTSEMPKTSSPAGMPQHSENLSDQEMPALCNEPPESSSEHQASVEQISKDAKSSRRFRRSRIFVEKDGILQVTRKWKGNYDFDLDSKFTNHPVEKTVCRGLHGSWNFTVKESGEETQLLIHMWIGLFYSRSTPRFIHSVPQDLEDCFETSDKKVLSPPVLETAAVSIGNAATDLDPTKEDGLISSQSVDILDLSIKKQVVNDSSDIAVSRQETNGKKASEAPVRDTKIQDEGTAQSQANLQAIKVYRSRPREFDDDNEGTNDYVVKSPSERADASPQIATNVSAVNSLDEDKTRDSLCKVIENVIPLPLLVAETNASIDPESSNKDGSDGGGRKENTQVAVDLPIEMDTACEFIRGIVEDPNSLHSNLVGTKEKDLDESKHKKDESGPDSQCTNAMSDGDDTISLDKNLPKEQDGDSRHEAVIEIVSQQNRSDNDCTLGAFSCDPQKLVDELIENEVETADIVVSHRQAHSPQDEVSKLLQDPNERPLVGKDNSKQEEEAGPQVLPLQANPDIVVSHHQAHSPQDEVSKLLQDPNERPLVGKDNTKQEEEAGPQVLPLQANPVPGCHFEPEEKAMYMDVDSTLLNNEKVPISDNVLSVCEDSESTPKLGSEDCEVDKRCSTHTKVDGPVVQCRATPVLQSHEGEGKKDPSSAEMLQRPCANTIAFMGGGDNYGCNDAIPEENMNIVLDETLPEESDHIDSMDEANLDILSKQDKAENDSTPSQDGIVAESQVEVLQDVSVICSDHREHNEELIEGKVETAYKFAEKADAHPQAQSPQDEVAKQSEMHSLGEDSLGEDSLGDTATQVLPFKVDTLEMGKEPKEMPMTINMYEQIFSVFDESNSEHELGLVESETSEYDERCPTPTVDENQYEDFPCLALSISGESSPENLNSPEEITGPYSTLEDSVEQELGKEVHEKPELKVVRYQDPGRDLGKENHTLSNRMLEINELSASQNQSPESTQRKSMDIDRSLEYVGVTPPKQLPVKRKMSFEEGFSVFVPSPTKKLSNHQGKCDAPVQSRWRDDSHPCTHSSVVATLLDNQRDVSTCSSKDDQHENELEICSKADRDSDHGVGECVLNKQNSIDALYHVKESGPWEPSRTVPATVSTHSEDGMPSSSSFQDPVEKILDHPSAIQTDPSTSSFKYTNYKFTKTVSKSLEPINERSIHSDLTQFSMEQDFLIFTEELKQLLTGSKCPGKSPNQGSMLSYPSSCGPQFVLDLSMDKDLPESAMKETVGDKIPYHRESSSTNNRAEANVVLSNIEAECVRSYHTTMDNVCAGKSRLTEPDGASRAHAGTSRQKRSEMFGSLNQGLNLVVRHSSKTKFRYFMLKTSEDAFFEKTRALLEADGHTEVRPLHFFREEQGSTSSLLLIILKNEDIAEHIIKVPHLLDLKKSANVLFAGIDRPEDIRNLTHQDLFKKGGFIMLEGIALDALSFCQMKALLDFVEELNKNGKWKWILHYRDIRRLKENTRVSAEGTEKRHLIKSCQESGIVEVLPYHECDQMCRPHPRYLKCLLQLQVQNISARFPVFVTDITNSTEDRAFGRHGILTMNINSLLTVIESENFSSGTSI